MKAEQQYIDLYTQCEAMIARHSSEVMNKPRAKAFADFRSLGFPTRKVEKYKYTDVAKLFEPDYGLNLNRLDIPVDSSEVFKCDVPNMSTSLYFMLNDGFDSRDLPKATLPAGVWAGSLKEFSTLHPELAEAHYGRLADTARDAVTALNTMLAQDGFVLYVPKGVVVERPIQLINMLRSNVDFMVNRRVLIILEEGAQARLLACDHAMDRVKFLATQVVEVFVGENAVFDFYELEETHTACTRLSNLYVRQEAGSNVLLNGMTLTCGTSRNTVRVRLDGEHAELDLCGLAIADQTPAANQAAQAKLGGMVLVKKHHTEIYASTGSWRLPIGSAAQAVGGMGDTLAGMIGGFCAQFRTDVTQAALAATYAHSAIADQLAENQYVVLPHQISHALPAFMKKVAQSGPDHQIGFMN